MIYLSKIHQLSLKDENEFSFSTYTSSYHEDNDWGSFLRRLQYSSLEKAISSLSLKERTVLLLHDSEDWSQKKIAHLLSVNKSTVSRTLKRARLKITKSLSIVF